MLTDTVTIDDATNIRLVSDLVGAPIDEIEALNPSLLRMVTPPDVSFDLHLPAGTATLFEQRATLIPEAKRNSWRYHPIAAGDTLQSVAQEYRVPMAELASVNQLSPTESVVGIEALVVPVPPVAEPLTRTRLYTVRRGDTLVTIADRFGVSLSQLRRWNGMPSGTRVDPGRRLHVAEPAPRSRIHHASPPDFGGWRQGRIAHPPHVLRFEAPSSPKNPDKQSARFHARPKADPQAARKTPGAQVRRRTQAGWFGQVLAATVKNQAQAAFDTCVLLVFMCKL